MVFLADFALRRVFNIKVMMKESRQLLADYATTRSETAFRDLVARYIDLVFSTALRLVGGDAHQAEDVAQTVFLDLSQQAGKMSDGILLGGWFHRHTCFVATKTMRSERRRQYRERQAAEMNAINQVESGFDHWAPVLDESINQLGEEDRTAILLRFYERRDLRSVGEALGSSENAAQKRVTRALEQLHLMLSRRGLTLSVAALGTVLAGEAVTAAPAGLAAGVVGAVAAGGAAGAAWTTLNYLNMTHLKLIAAGAIAVVAVIIPVAQNRSLSQLRQENRSLQRQLDEEARLIQQSQAPSNLLVRSGDPQVLAKPELNELLRLRGEVGRLRNTERELARLRGEAARLAAAEGTNSSAQDPGSPGSPPFFFVGGEFALPNRFLWTNGMTLASAIALAHGF